MATRQPPKNQIAACSSPKSGEQPGGDERADEHAEPERAAEQRQRAGAEGQGHARRHEGVPGEAEGRGAEADEEDGCREHADVRARRPCPPTPTSDTTPAIAIVSRSPMRATAHPAGMLPQSWPTTSAEATRRGDGDVGAELRGEHGKQRDDRALAEREQQGRPVDHRARTDAGRSRRCRSRASTLVWSVMLELDLSADIQALRSTFADIRAVVDVERLAAEIAHLSEEAGAPDLWDDTDKAQKVTSALSHRQSELAKHQRASSRGSTTSRCSSSSPTRWATRTPPTRPATSSPSCENIIGELEVQTLLDGEYDDRPAVVTIRAGAGGVDAADFAEMLLRMYLRWAEQHKYPVTIMDTSYAEEAGIKSATFEVDAPYAFGTLSVEAGTHRLVRMSPFNSAGKRQTSLRRGRGHPAASRRPSRSRSPRTTSASTCSARRGPGGQSVNTTDSAVRLTHLPTGIVVSMQNEKSQIQNRAAAMRVLQSRLLILQREQEAATKKELAGIITASWGDQMRSYVLAPYQMVKDLRTDHEVNNPSAVFDGDLDGFIAAGIRWRKRPTED